MRERWSSGIPDTVIGIDGRWWRGAAILVAAACRPAAPVEPERPAPEQVQEQEQEVPAQAERADVKWGEYVFIAAGAKLYLEPDSTGPWMRLRKPALRKVEAVTERHIGIASYGFAPLACARGEAPFPELAFPVFAETESLTPLTQDTISVAFPDGTALELGTGTPLEPLGDGTYRATVAKATFEFPLDDEKVSLSAPIHEGFEPPFPMFRHPLEAELTVDGKVVRNSGEYRGGTRDGDRALVEVYFGCVHLRAAVAVDALWPKKRKKPAFVAHGITDVIADDENRIAQLPMHDAWVVPADTLLALGDGTPVGKVYAELELDTQPVTRGEWACFVPPRVEASDGFQFCVPAKAVTQEERFYVGTVLAAGMRDGPRPETRAIEVSTVTVDGRLLPFEAYAALDMKAVRACAKDAKTPPWGWSLRAKAAVDKTGALTGVHAPAQTDAIGTCVLHVLRRSSFPAPDDGKPANIQLYFFPVAQ